MNILFVNRMLSMCRGGGETFDMEMGRTLHKMGHRISYLSGIPLFSGAGLAAPDGCRVRNAEPQIHWHTIRSPYSGWLPWDRLRGGWRLRLFDFKCFEWLAAHWVYRHEHEYDVIQVCELPFFVNYYKKTGGCLPVVIRLTAPDYDDPVRGLQQADAVVASGMSIQAVRAKDRPDCCDIPNCVNTMHFCPVGNECRSELGLAVDDFVVIFVARFQAVKNHEMLVHAFRSVVNQRANAKLVLAGSGPHEERIKSLVYDLGLDSSVIFLGEVAFSDLPEFYRSADAGVVSSDYESFCFAALEAMATALPVVTTDNGWVPQLLGRGDVDSEVLSPGYQGSDDGIHEYAGGLVVPKKNPERMAEAILRLAEDTDMREKMGKRNRDEVVEKYNWARSAEILEKRYREILIGMD